MGPADLDAVAGWLRQPHVARWWGGHAEEIASMRRRLVERVEPGTRMVIVSAGARPIGWAQWYRWDDHPDEATAMDAHPADVGTDDASGDPAATERAVAGRPPP